MMSLGRNGKKREFGVRSSEFGVRDRSNAIIGVSGILNQMGNQGLSIRRTHVKKDASTAAGEDAIAFNMIQPVENQV